MYQDGKPYYSIDAYYKEHYKTKVYRLPIDAGLTCPTRDGSLHTGGCIFCSKAGSGDFTPTASSISKQIDMAKKFYNHKSQGPYCAYFQAYTNTYAKPEVLRELYLEAINCENIVELSIATRPDCLGEDILNLLEEIRELIPVTVELGLQTSNEATADFIRRGYKNPVYEEAVRNLHKIGIFVVTHMIIGLPGEDSLDYLETARYIARNKSDGIKLQLLHVLKDSDLYPLYCQNTFATLSLEEYVSNIVSIIEHLPPDMVIFRITGDGDKKNLIAPMWSGNKRMVLNTIHHEFRIRNTYQGRLYTDGFQNSLQADDPIHD